MVPTGVAPASLVASVAAADMMRLPVSCCPIGARHNVNMVMPGFDPTPTGLWASACLKVLTIAPLSAHIETLVENWIKVPIEFGHP